MLLDQIKTDMNLGEGEVTMFVMDIPNVPPQNIPVMIAQAGQAKSSNASAIRTMGICFPAPNELYSLENVFDPAAAARTYLWNYEHKTIERTLPATITFLQQPSHGILRLLTEADRGVLFSDTSGPVDPSDPGYVYLPQKGYVGKDKAVALVEIAGVKVKVIYYIQAIEGGVGDINHWCGKKGYGWKISSTLDADGNGTIAAVDYLPSFTN